MRSMMVDNESETMTRSPQCLSTAVSYSLGRGDTRSS